MYLHYFVHHTFDLICAPCIFNVCVIAFVGLTSKPRPPRKRLEAIRKRAGSATEAARPIDANRIATAALEAPGSYPEVIRKSQNSHVG